ncbi:hypothetical protein CFIO01_11375 [Colletotrichum fioriniae PJ7]|uniref:Uncharacterized protein n=1 Tax=Colletotrichum fioriniae PJ7 TaxID=1445577 RepID=A0A010QGJ3_9PEZI|nr:hypothetical protein CFIO01_11375 [Colletotrichum fioriniae PJ7]
MPYAAATYDIVPQTAFRIMLWFGCFFFSGPPTASSVRAGAVLELV